jgi:hypothetical protein
VTDISPGAEGCRSVLRSQLVGLTGSYSNHSSFSPLSPFDGAGKSDSCRSVAIHRRKHSNNAEDNRRVAIIPLALSQDETTLPLPLTLPGPLAGRELFLDGQLAASGSALVAAPDAKFSLHFPLPLLPFLLLLLLPPHKQNSQGPISDLPRTASNVAITARFRSLQIIVALASLGHVVIYYHKNLPRSLPSPRTKILVGIDPDEGAPLGVNCYMWSFKLAVTWSPTAHYSAIQQKLRKMKLGFGAC